MSHSACQSVGLVCFNQFSFVCKNKALEEIENNETSDSSYDEDTDEEWEEERMKQQAIFEKDQVLCVFESLSCIAYTIPKIVALYICIITAFFPKISTNFNRLCFLLRIVHQY